MPFTDSQLTTALAFALGFGLGVLLVGGVAWLLIRQRTQRELSARGAWERAAAEAERAAAGLREELAAMVEAWRESEQELRRLAEDHGRASALAEGRAEALAVLQERERALEQRIDALRERVGQLDAERAGLVSRMAAERDRDGWVQRSEEQLTQAFERVGRTLLEDSGRSLTLLQQEQLGTLLTPLREQLGEFRRRVEDVHVADNRDRASLLTEVRKLQQATDGINQEARQLTDALRGDKKLQGNWGELVLTRVLEASGLRAGHEFELQPAFRNDEGELKRPDVVVRLPEGRDLVVDAKVSLVAWEQARAADDEATRQRLLARHAADLRAQMQRLAVQGYAELPGLAAPDFVLLFVPIEAALAAALEADPELLPRGFEQRVLVVGPTTLLLALRIVEQTWRRDRQHRQTEEIARRATALHDRIRGCVEDLERIGRQITALQRGWDTAMGRLATGRSSALAQARAFIEIGAGAAPERVDEEAGDRARLPEVPPS
ncbi:MAG: DNA recombination protein RmuC [Pseudomonadales bacterium]|jgi:DNA recombination protein RmuC|nr:DNA recombination protein RmuC [Pseudomonadales bacterium]